ncbi:hypothetical protein [Stenotrophomonas sp. P5_B8]
MNRVDRMNRMCAGLIALSLAAPALAADPPTAWVERQKASEADADLTPTKDAPKEHCRVVKEWKVGEVVAQHRICEDPPKAPAVAAPEKNAKRA